MLYFRC